MSWLRNIVQTRNDLVALNKTFSAVSFAEVNLKKRVELKVSNQFRRILKYTLISSATDVFPTASRSRD